MKYSAPLCRVVHDFHVVQCAKSCATRGTRFIEAYLRRQNLRADLARVCISTDSNCLMKDPNWLNWFEFKLAHEVVRIRTMTMYI